jgi:hypothetical protein
MPAPFDAALVAGDTRHEALLGPAAVAVHDDGDMARHIADTGMACVELVNFPP